MTNQTLNSNFTSIIWVHWGMDIFRRDLSKKSLESLISTTINSDRRIIVIDNGESLEDSKWFLDKTGEKGINCYIRNYTNFSFGYARNQGLKLCTGDYIVISDNDILYKQGWLEECLEVFEEYPDEKIIVSHLNYPTPVLREKYTVGELGKYKLNMRAGSNCFMMKRSTFEEIGEFKIHRVAGTKFTDSLVKAGYLTAVILEPKVFDLAFRKGYDLNKEIEHLEL